MRIVCLFVLASSVGCLRFDVTQPTNNKPTVEAGDDVVVDGGDTVTLTAVGQDEDEDPLTFRWAQVTGTAVEYSGGDTPEITFVAPLRHETLTFAVRADDGIETSEPSLAHVDVLFNRPPVAHAGDLYEGFNRQPIWLDGSATDPDGELMDAWTWTVVDGPLGVSLEGLLTGADTRTPIFRSDQVGEYTVSLVADDGTDASEPDLVQVITRDNPPIAAIDSSRADPALPVYTLSASRSSDPDDDPIVSYRWTIVAAPIGGSAAFTSGIDDVESVELTLSGRGGYTVELEVAEDDGLWSEPMQAFLSGNAIPSLLVADTEYLVEEGGTFSVVNPPVTNDLDGDPITVLWTRVDGAEILFPPQLVGETPSFAAPSMVALLNAGSSWAAYDVVASDGLNASPPQRVTFYVLPAEANFVVVDGDSGADVGGCGARDNACATIRFGLGEITSGARDLLVTYGIYTEATPTTNTVNVLDWPAAVSLHGGLDPVNFAFSERSVLETTKTGAPGAGCGHNNDHAGIYLDGTIGSDVIVEGVVVRHTSLCDIIRNSSIRCHACQARIRNVELVGLGPAHVGRGLFVSGGADLTVSDSVIRAIGGGTWRSALRIDAATATVTETRVYTQAIENAALDKNSYGVWLLNGGTLVGDRMTIELGGPELVTDYPNSAALRVSDGSVSLSNSVIRAATGLQTPAVRHTSTSAITLTYNTIIGPSSLGTVESSHAAALHLAGVANLIGNLVLQAPLAVDIRNTDAQGSLIFGNNFSTTEPGRCLDTAAALTDFNAAAGGLCNDSGQDWAGNLAVFCALQNVGANDVHLADLDNNPCVDAGLTSAPSGSAPAYDLDGDARPAGSAPDIGADEAN